MNGTFLFCLQCSGLPWTMDGRDQRLMEWTHPQEYLHVSEEMLKDFLRKGIFLSCFLSFFPCLPFLPFFLPFSLPSSLPSSFPNSILSLSITKATVFTEHQGLALLTEFWSIDLKQTNKQTWLRVLSQFCTENLIMICILKTSGDLCQQTWINLVASRSFSFTWIIAKWKLVPVLEKKSGRH